MPEVAKKIGLSTVFSIPAAILSFLIQEVLKAWGVLNPLSEWLGGWLKMHVSPAQAGWTIACVITLVAYAVLLWLVWKRGNFSAAVGGDIHAPMVPSGMSAALSSSPRAVPLNIELGADGNYVKEEHFGNGLFRRTISIAVVNDGAEDIHGCNIKLVASTPRPMTGNTKSSLPIGFIPNFDLSAGKRKYVEVVSLVENGRQAEQDRDSIRIHAAVGGYFGGWTALSPLPTKDNPAILTLESFAPTVASSQTRIKVWVDNTLGRKLCASIA